MLMAQDRDPNNTRLTSSKPEPWMVAQSPPAINQAFSDGMKSHTGRQKLFVHKREKMKLKYEAP